LFADDPAHLAVDDPIVIKPFPMERTWLGNVSTDFSGAELGDARRSARLTRIVEAIDRDPSAGFPHALESEAELEAFYRFVNNDSFDANAIWQPHIEATRERALAAKRVVVVHDTTTIEFQGEGTRRGLGYTTALGRQGFMAHVALCLDASSAVPLGITHVEAYSRTGRTWAQRKQSRRTAPKGARESARWIRGVDALQQDSSTPDRLDVLHVMDAEADFFGLFEHLTNAHARFVIRAGQLDRTVSIGGERMSLRGVVDSIEPRVWRAISLSKRVHPKKKRGSNGLRRHPPRAGRSARVAVGAQTVRVPRTRYLGTAVDKTVVLNVVRVWEERPPRGEPGVEWVLFTSEPIETAAHLAAVVDNYRLRWTIEEYFKALKTGCALERRQTESYDALKKVLAILAPIACRLLCLRNIQRTAPTADATNAFSDLELTLLHRAPGVRGSARPRTVADALALLARLGGHIKNNGAPGWITLGRGYEKLLLLRVGWELAIQRRRYDRC
jgi:hypothetical protein